MGGLIFIVLLVLAALIVGYSIGYDRIAKSIALVVFDGTNKPSEIDVRKYIPKWPLPEWLRKLTGGKTGA